MDFAITCIGIVLGRDLFTARMDMKQLQQIYGHVSQDRLKKCESILYHYQFYIAL